METVFRICRLGQFKKKFKNCVEKKLSKSVFGYYKTEKNIFSTKKRWGGGGLKALVYCPLKKRTIFAASLNAFHNFGLKCCLHPEIPS